MSVSLGREKALPGVPVDIDDSKNAVAHEEPWLVPSSRIASTPNAGKALPSINVENTLPQQEMSRLHELWNEAGLSARAHRRRRHDQNPTSRWIPALISIPDPDDNLPVLSSVDISIAGTTPSDRGTRKRWGFLSARPHSEKQEAKKAAPNALGILRAMAQDRLKQKLRYAKSAPNLGDQGAPFKRRQRAAPRRAEVVPKDVLASGPHTLSLVGELATPTPVFQPEDMDNNAIYFTMDPTWRASQGSMLFQCITPIPDRLTSLGRPDSPLLHRHHSLDQLSFAAQEALTAIGFPVAHPSDQVLHPVDELHAYLEL